MQSHKVKHLTSLLARMERFSTYFGLKLSVLVFGATEQLSATLQYRGINAQEATSAVSVAKSFRQATV